MPRFRLNIKAPALRLRALWLRFQCRHGQHSVDSQRHDDREARDGTLYHDGGMPVEEQELDLIVIQSLERVKDVSVVEGDVDRLSLIFHRDRFVAIS